MNDLHLNTHCHFVPVSQSLSQIVCVKLSLPYPIFTENKAELNGLLFDLGLRLCDVGAATAEGVCQN